MFTCILCITTMSNKMQQHFLSAVWCSNCNPGVVEGHPGQEEGTAQTAGCWYYSQVWTVQGWPADDGPFCLVGTQVWAYIWLENIRERKPHLTSYLPFIYISPHINLMNATSDVVFLTCVHWRNCVLVWIGWSLPCVFWIVSTFFKSSSCFFPQVHQRLHLPPQGALSRERVFPGLRALLLPHEAAQEPTQERPGQELADTSCCSCWGGRGSYVFGLLCIIPVFFVSHLLEVQLRIITKQICTNAWTEHR